VSLAEQREDHRIAVVANRFDRRSTQA
jgi:hypothetical protein